MVTRTDEVKNDDIHKWNEKFTEYKEINYPKPIVDHSIQRKKALDMYKNFRYTYKNI